MNVFKFLFQIDIDFEYLHPGKGGLLFNKWDCFVEKIIPLMKSKIKDANSRDLLEQLENICDANQGIKY